MQVVIDIPEEQYLLIRHYQDIAPNKTHSLAMSIINGTPLPKGHGDLIDRSLLSPDSDYEDGLFYAVSIGQINGAPTIIEADMESEK